MSHPEISKRCLACGAAVRAGARFCPQCGGLTVPDSAAAAAADNGASMRVEGEIGDVVETPAMSVEASAPSPKTAVQTDESAAAQSTTNASGAKPTTTVVRREHRASSMRRPAEMVRENLRPRVEKLRDASLTVFEDASEDTGLRFVLIAVALFLVFLLLLLLNNIIK